MLIGQPVLGGTTLDDYLIRLGLAQPPVSAGTPSVLDELGLTGPDPIPETLAAPVFRLDQLGLSAVATTTAPVGVFSFEQLGLATAAPASTAVSGGLRQIQLPAAARPTSPAPTSVRESGSSWLPEWLNPTRLVAGIADALPTWANPVTWFRSSSDAPTAAGRVSVSRYRDGYHLQGALPGSLRPDRGEDRQAQAAFDAMKAAAARDGITLTENSHYRSVARQRQLWNASDKSGRWVARPGSSEHHTGLAFDIGTRGYRAGSSGNFQNSPAYRWLKENAYRFGFVQSMDWESWHWRYDPQAVQTALGPSATSGTAWA